MNYDHYDKIYITDLFLRCIIGLRDWEREKLQDVVLNITLYCDTRLAGDSDQIRDAIDYKVITKNIITFVEQSKYQTLEALVNHVAALILVNKNINATKVHIEKIGALRFSKSVGIEVFRENQ